MSDAHNLSAARFTVGQIADATGISAHTIRDWYKRGAVTLGPDDRASAETTFARRLTARSAIMIAIVGALVSRGIAVKEAAYAAMEFAHSGDEDRDPGRLFADGSTYLLVGAADCSVTQVLPTTPFEDVFADQLHGLEHLPIITALRLDELVDRVRVRLGLDRDPLTPMEGEAGAGYVEPGKRAQYDGAEPAKTAPELAQRLREYNKRRQEA